MLYLEDYLELIEHLPQELRDRLTLIRENDLKVNNSSQQIDTKVKQFFAEAKNLSPEQKQCNYESILGDYEDSIKNAGEKLHLADQTSEIMVKLIQRLDGELEKFKLELEADHAGITEQLERRSLELDSGIHSDDAINGFPNSSPSSTRHSGNFKDRRRSEHNQRHHPYHRNHNGYHVRAKLSKDHHNHDGIRVTLQSKQTPRHNHQNYRMIDGRYHPSNSSRQNSTATSPTLFGSTPASKPSSIVNEYNALGGQVNGSGHYNTNLTSFGNQGFKTSYKNNNLSYGHHHSALSAALSSATSPTTVHGNKISQNGLGQQLDHLGYTNRNALAPMAPDQQAYRYNQQHVKMNGNSSPLCVSVTKSGRPSKRPKHHASHLYPDESPASISSDISVFENSESLSSADFLHEQSPAFSSTSPSFDYGRSHMNDQGGGAIGEYQLDQTKYCICRQVSYGGMVACDNEECEIQWFHFGCVGLTEEPPGKWYCPECLISIGSQHKKNQAQTQPQQKKRGRKEKSAYNLMNSSRESTHLKTQERIVSAE